MKNFFRNLFCIIDRIEHEEIKQMCKKEKCCECKDKNEKECCSTNRKKEVR